MYSYLYSVMHLNIYDEYHIYVTLYLYLMFNRIHNIASKINWNLTTVISSKLVIIQIKKNIIYLYRIQYTSYKMYRKGNLIQFNMQPVVLFIFPCHYQF